MLCQSCSRIRSLRSTWHGGASQEILTLRGYEQIVERTRNPVLAELCRRIAKQERRHFAWYYNNASERLARSRVAQRLTREVFERFWSPVGAGVKSQDAVDEICLALFPGDAFAEVALGIDEKLAKLPGFSGFDVVSRFARRVADKPEARTAFSASDDSVAVARAA